MSIAAAHATKFYEQVVSEGAVYTVEDSAEYLVFRIRDHDVVPFWSSDSRVRAIQDRNPKYRKWNLTRQPLAEFMSRTLPLLEREGIHVGLNWSGERLVGYDVSVQELRSTLEHRTGKKSETAETTR